MLKYMLISFHLAFANFPRAILALLSMLVVLCPMERRFSYTILIRSSHRRCSMEKGVLRNFTKFTGKHLCQNLVFNKLAGLRPATLLKKRVWHRCFPVNFVKFLKTPFLQNTSGRLLLPNVSSYFPFPEKFSGFSDTSFIWPINLVFSFSLCLHARHPCTIFKILYARHLFAVHCHVVFRLCVHGRYVMSLTVTYYKYLGLTL